jgi:hypothetical protein
MLEPTRLNPSLKYPWQQAVLDVLRESERERLPDKITEAERVLSARLHQEPADPDEQLALRGAEIALECARHVAMEKC